MNNQDRPDPLNDRARYEQWYFSLTDQQRFEEWQRYYQNSGNGYQAYQELPADSPKAQSQRMGQSPEANPRKVVVTRKKRRLHPATILLLVAFGFVAATSSQAVKAQVGQFLQPVNQEQIERPVIIEPSGSIVVGPENRIIIPKINVDVPVVYDEPSFEEAAIQEALDRGVVHYGTTGFPGELRNNVIVGHSSNNFFNDGEYKFAFVLLEQLELGDVFILHHEGTRYVYEIFNREVIDPSDLRLIQDTGEAITTLITCTPPGTAWKRFVIQARQISPAVSTASDITAQDSTSQAEQEEDEVSIPGNGQSIWSEFVDWLF